MSAGRILAVIPARGGSKRLPGKNKRRLAGKPLVQWTIDAALASRRLACVMVSTDDPEIAAISRQTGAETPFLRPAELATDTADSVSVARHALEYYKGLGERFDAMILLQPTSPLRTTGHIDAAVGLMESKQASAVISVCVAEHTPLGMNTLPPSGSMDGFVPEGVAHKRGQDLPVYHRINGAIYLVATPVFTAESTFFPARGSFALVMDRRSSLDIDDEVDFWAAEAAMRARNHG